MNASPSEPEGAAGKKVATELRVERERSRFHQLLLSNPNYFGNLPESKFKAVKVIAANTRYEELTCLGFNPKLNTLEATVHIKRPTGYGGSLCQNGTIEYVRFFIDYGSGWQDAGLASFDAHSIANSKDCAGKPDKPLSYVVSLPIDPQRKFCSVPVMPRVRAILSWQVMPPANPNWVPVYGNVVDAHIQITPRFWNLSDLVGVLGEGIGQKLALPLELDEIKLNPLPTPDPAPLGLADLVQMYAAELGAGTRESASHGANAKTNVEPHRFGFNEVYSALSLADLSQPAIVAKAEAFQALGIDWQSVLAALEDTQGNVSYEEVDCLGLDNNRSWLAATFTIKRPTGYLGGLCQKGSKEYVAFWADWNDTCDWIYLGTVDIAVHDIASIPADGLHYTALWPVDLEPYRQHCSKPKIARVRAVLSWNTPPSTVDPDDIPFWGNRLDAHVQIKPGEPAGIAPKISILGGIGLASIDTVVSGLTKPNALFSQWAQFADPYDPSRQCPFGGSIHVQAPRISGHKYRLWVRKAGDPTSEVKLTEPVQVTDIDGITSNVFPVGDGFFPYLEPEQNVNSMLYNRWSPNEADLWEIRLELFTWGEIFLGSTAWHKIRVKNTKPQASVSVDGAPCDEYFPGVIINGHFIARDPYFGHYILDTLPDSVSPPNPTPASGTLQTSPAPGNVWTLNTTGMDACGYVIVLHVYDRTIVNSHPSAHNDQKDDLGFCLLAPPA